MYVCYAKNMSMHGEDKMTMTKCGHTAESATDADIEQCHNLLQLPNNAGLQELGWYVAPLLARIEANEAARLETINEIEQKFLDFWSEKAVKHDYAFHPSLLFRLLGEMRRGQ